MTAFPLKIVTPEKIFFDGSAERVVLRTSEGDLCILARHEPFVASLPSGPVRITMQPSPPAWCRWRRRGLPSLPVP